MNRQDHYRVAGGSKVDRVRKPMEHGPSRFAVDGRKSQWRLADPENQPLHRLRELSTEARTARLVPASNLESLAFGLRPEDDLQHG